jgi:hypothetical protein
VEFRAPSSSASPRDALLREAFETLRVALKYATFAYFAYCGWRSVSSLAGKTTGADLDVVVRAAVEIGKEEWPPWALAALMAVWAISERRYRQIVTARLLMKRTRVTRHESG